MRIISRKGTQIRFVSDESIINKVSESVLSKMRKKNYNVSSTQIGLYSSFNIVVECKKWERTELQLMSEEAIRDLFATITESVKELRV